MKLRGGLTTEAGSTTSTEIGALLALDGKWQPLEKRRALLDAVLARAVAVLDESIEANKDSNPFLKGVPGILAALRSRQIDCRVYDREKFHTKAYITHAKLEVEDMHLEYQALLQAGAPLLDGTERGLSRFQSRRNRRVWVP